MRREPAEAGSYLRLIDSCIFLTRCSYKHVSSCLQMRREAVWGCVKSRRSSYTGLYPQRLRGWEVGSYLRLIDSCITQLKVQGPSRTCNESKEEEAARLGGGQVFVRAAEARVGHESPRVWCRVCVCSNTFECMSRRSEVESESQLDGDGVICLKSGVGGWG